MILFKIKYWNTESLNSKKNNRVFLILQKNLTFFLQEKRIYDLKKKNQELEKFKFVLDYKIKEQKKMVEPREMEIKDLKEEKTKMESELERFYKQNDQLDLNNKEKDAKLEATQKELREERAKVIHLGLYRCFFSGGNFTILGKYNFSAEVLKKKP